MDKRYAKYDASRFSTDPFFLSWRLLDDPGARAFWESFRERHPGKREEIDAAIRVVDSARFNHETLPAEEIRQEVERLYRTVHRLRRWRLARKCAVAASVLLALLLPALFLARDAGSDPPGDLAVMVARARQQKVRLELAGRQVVELERDAVIAYKPDGVITTGSDESEPLAGRRDTIGEIPVDRLVVPDGRRAELLLPDGSKIWLNAGSAIEFPARFPAGSREARASGEIYIEVAPDATRPFTLHAPRFSVNATGTTFQVTAYAGEQEQSVVLVEGEISVILPGELPVPVHPSGRFVLDGNTGRVERVDPLDYTSWKDGVLRFTNRPLRDVLASLSRYYGIPVEYEGEGEERLSGKLILLDDLTTVLENISVIIPSRHEVREEGVIVRSGKK
ncbi:MAG: FecR domain-containing protein [Odoribacteraceae bacterium]|jgi:ferric-dicitrate binding protein FerR (iron transport regulator)|nr:FecR domain-containing protein [Odoribacteraceae bacterium]